MYQCNFCGCIFAEPTEHSFTTNYLEGGSETSYELNCPECDGEDYSEYYETEEDEI